MGDLTQEMLDGRIIDEDVLIEVTNYTSVEQQPRAGSGL